MCNHIDDIVDITYVPSLLFALLTACYYRENAYILTLYLQQQPISQDHLN